MSVRESGVVAQRLPLVRQVVSLLERQRLNLSDEKALQVEIAGVLEASRLPYRREVRLTARDIVDFMVGDGVAIEVKIKGARRAIYRQLERYCAHDDVRAIVLATNVAMGLPPDILGKVTAVALLSRGWL